MKKILNFVKQKIEDTEKCLETKALSGFSTSGISTWYHGYLAAMREVKIKIENDGFEQLHQEMIDLEKEWDRI